MIEAIRWARENDLPFFGICLGLQVAIIEFARNVCGMPETNSTEFEPDCADAGHRADAVAARRERPWAAPCGSARTRPGSGPGSRVAQAYGTHEISERHRHRWEVSNAYRDVLAEYGLRLSGQSPDGGLVETIELPDHAWFIGCQFHPELKSRPDAAASAVRRASSAPRSGAGAAVRRRAAPKELAEIGR